MTSRMITNIAIGVIPLLFMIFYIITYNGRLNTLGKRLISDSDSVDMSYKDFIGPILILLSIRGISNLNPTSIFRLTLGLSIIIQRIIRRKQSEDIGLFENGIILQKGIINWKKVHSVTPKEGWTDVLLDNGTCLEYRGLIKPQDIVKSFNYWQNQS